MTKTKKIKKNNFKSGSSLTPMKEKKLKVMATFERISGVPKRNERRKSLACRSVTNAEIVNERGERESDLGLLEQSSLRGPLFAQSSSIFNLTSLEYDRSQELSTSSVSSTDTPSTGLVSSSTDPSSIPDRQ